MRRLSLTSKVNPAVYCCLGDFAGGGVAHTEIVGYNMHMKILICHNAGEEDDAEHLAKIAAGSGSETREAVTLAFPPHWQSDMEPVTLQLNDATHIVVFGAAGSDWFSFMAGFALGSHCPIIYYGTGGDLGYAPTLVLLNDEAGLSRYLEQASVAADQNDATGKARDRLLGMGIPVSIEFFAKYVHEGNADMVFLFFDAGFSADAKDQKGVPMLCAAARAGVHEMVLLLLDKKCDVNQKSDDRGTTALVDAALGKNSEIVQTLINAGADVNAKSKDGQSALIIAVGLGDVATVRLLLKAGANADDPDRLGATARKYAQLFHQAEIVALFAKYAPQE
jgi:hypothetical protein